MLGSNGPKPRTVRIDRGECIRCGSCWILCPDVFEDDWHDGYSQIVERYRLDGIQGEGLVPADLDECVREAAEDCPVQIIRVE
jgi:ferredoxin